MKAAINITGFHRAVLIAITGFVAAYPSPCPASADIIIYSDTFVRSGALNGTQLGVSTSFTGTGGHGGSGSASWTAAASITTDGLSANGGAQKNAYMPFRPETGHLYTYTLELDPLCLPPENGCSSG